MSSSSTGDSASRSHPVINLDKEDVNDVNDNKEKAPDPVDLEKGWTSLVKVRDDAHQRTVALEKKLKADYEQLLKEKEAAFQKKTKAAQEELERKNRELHDLNVELKEKSALVTKLEMKIEDLKAKAEKTFRVSKDLAKKHTDCQKMLLELSGLQQPSTSADGQGNGPQPGEERRKEVPVMPNIPLANLGRRTWIDGRIGGEELTAPMPTPVGRQSQASQDSGSVSFPDTPTSEAATQLISFLITPRLTRSCASSVVSTLESSSQSSATVGVISNMKRSLSNASQRYLDTLGSDKEEDPLDPLFGPSPPKKHDLRVRKPRKTYAAVYR